MDTNVSKPLHPMAPKRPPQQKKCGAALLCRFCEAKRSLQSPPCGRRQRPQSLTCTALGIQASKRSPDLRQRSPERIKGHCEANRGMLGARTPCKGSLDWLGKLVENTASSSYTYRFLKGVSASKTWHPTKVPPRKYGTEQKSSSQTFRVNLASLVAFLNLLRVIIFFNPLKLLTTAQSR